MNLQALDRQVFADKKAEELREEAGGNVSLELILPDGQVSNHEFPAGVTVAYVKLIIEQQHSYPVAQQVLLLDDKPLLDPFSLSDYPAMSAGKQARLMVQLKQ